MGYLCVGFLILGLGSAWAQPAIPDTPAGRTFEAWLEAFNSGDQARLAAYYKKHEPGRSAERMMGFRKRTGGFDLLAITRSEPLRIEFRVKERNSETVGLGALEVKEDQPADVIASPLIAIPPGAEYADFRIDAATRDRVIDGAIEKLHERYVFPDKAKEMEEALRRRQARGEYDGVEYGDKLAKMLTEHLQEVSHDKHLRVSFSPAPQPERPREPSPDRTAQLRKRMERMNCGFEKVERLDGNVGYVKFNMFANPDICGPTVVAAMNFVAHTDAVIFDLRDNGGGDPKMVAMISSYLFSKPTHLNDLWERKGDKTTQYWTLPYVPGKRMGDEPVFVLTSSRTFSGAEEFCYNLQNLRRATIVGETTGGGAHPVSGHRIDERFSIGVPFARAINPISKTNWEGTGIQPDVKTPADEALREAERLAREKLDKQ